MKRWLFYSIVCTGVAITLLLLSAVTRVFSDMVDPLRYEELHEQRIYAYRDWQSVGVQIHADESVEIRAQGEWLYTPGEYHGPEGHPRYPAPVFYPMANVPGGVLIGRVGETGEPFLVGRHTWFSTRDNQEQGLLYFRINDDILSDNKGSVAVGVTVSQLTADEYR